MKLLRQEQGYAMLLVILTTVLISVISLGLLTMNVNSVKTSKNEEVDQAVFYIAEAGINLAKLEVQEELVEIQSRSYQAITGWIANQNSIRKSTKQPRLTKSEAEVEYRRILNNEFSAFNANPPVLNSHQISPGKVAAISLDTTLPADNEPLFYRISITSEGNINNAKERTVTQEIKIEPRLPFPDDDNGNDGNNSGETGQTPDGFPEGYAAIVSGNIILSEGGSIIGSAASKEGSISITGSSTGRISGDVSIQNIQNISIPEEGRNDTAQTAFINSNYAIVPNLNIDPKSYLSPTFFPDDKFLAANSLSYATKHTIGDQWNPYDVIDNQGNYNAPHTWRDPNYKLNLSTGSSTIKFKNFTVDTGNEFIIDIGDNREVDIYIDNLNIKNGNITIRGNGKLNIYAKNITAFVGPFNQNGNSSQLTIYHQGSSQVELGSHSKISGSFINKSSNMILTSGAAIYGNIVSGGRNIEISGGVSTNGQYILAPNATLNLKEGGNITGIVVVDNINSSGGTSITYGEPASLLPPGVIPEIEIEDSPYPAPNEEENSFWIVETNMIEN